MHELGVAESIVDIVRAHVPIAKAPAVREVRIRVGDRAGVLVESLEFCFGVAVAGTPYASAVLTVDRVAGDDLHVVHVELADEAEVTA
ncbi:MAG: hydrogenase maturation nickel metallochaperone HypA [Vicinamibacterales bacterium]|nr:hydrogenase maturation nickel metallochaperone HypA [Vicinamibacterales bacterium]